jgi:signal transduction histidine kinase/putative methionine-R-sulfoxide reductase with GAF domain
MPNDSLNSEEAEVRKTLEIQVMREMRLVFEPTMSLDDILTLIVNKTTMLMGAMRSTLFLKKSDESLVSRVLEGDGVTEIRLAPGQGVAGWTARHGRPLLVHDAYKDERFDSSWDREFGFTTYSIICHPITDQRGSVIGVIEALNKQDGLFDQNDLNLLSLIAEQVSLTIQNSKLLVDLVRKNRDLIRARYDLRKTNREISLLLDLERRVAESVDLSSLFVSILSRTREAVGAKTALLYRIDETGAEVRRVGEHCTDAEIIRVPVGIGFAGWVANKGEPLCLVDSMSDPRFSEEMQQLIDVPHTSLAAVPLTAVPSGMQKGALLVHDKIDKEGFDADDMEMLGLVGSRLTQAIAHFSNQEEQERDRRLATVGRLMAGVLHDIRSPITVISGYAELLAQKVDNEEGEAYIDGLNRAVSRIISMAEEIIAFSRGERDLLLAAHDTQDLIQQFIKEIEPVLERNHITLKSHIRTSGNLLVDREKLLRVFHNIALNAVESMVKDGNLTIEVDRVGDHIEFGISDTGPGIPDEIRGSLFRSFVTHGKRQGTGLGLAVSREIVEAHGGTISFTTVTGRGTTFFIRIPV